MTRRLGRYGSPRRPRAALARASIASAVLAVWACSPAAPEPARAMEFAPPALPSPAAQTVARAERVPSVTGPGQQPFEVALRAREPVAGHARRIGTRTFEIALRSDEPTSYPCSSCHTARGTIQRTERAADAHANIQPVHPSESGAACATCHSPANVERLVLAGGETVSLDHAYRLCGQCHFAQLNDWAGGAHGKRLDGWSGRRVVMGCADCHDPHRPAVGQRIPYPGPRLPGRGGHLP